VIEFENNYPETGLEIKQWLTSQGYDEIKPTKKRVTESPDTFMLHKDSQFSLS
jgi:hypothetical protein